MDDDSTVTDTPPGNPPPPNPPSPRRLERSRTDRWLTGVCGGLGTYFGIDPLIFRIAFIVLTVAGGAGLWLYLAGWLLLPEEGARHSIVHHALGHRSLVTIAAIVLIAIGVGNLTSELNVFDGGRMVWALLLIGGGVYLFRSTSGDRSAGPPGSTDDPADGPPPPPPAEPPPAATTPLPAWGSAWSTPAAPPPPHAPPTATVPWSAPMAPVPKGRSVTPFVISLLLVGGGAAAFLDAAHVVDLSPVPVLAICVLVTGIALILTTWWGRGRGLIAVGIILALALGVATTADALDLPLRGEVGDRQWRPTDITAVRPEYRLRMGQLTVDLTAVSFAGIDRTVAASVGIGELVVLVPDAVGVDVNARVGMGAIGLFGREDGGGVGVERTRHAPAATPESGHLQLRMKTGIGRLEVRRASSLIPPFKPGFAPPWQPPIDPNRAVEVPDAAA
jgi:phage shock protein PspC (stress-responsive transcriptional regulator)